MGQVAPPAVRTFRLAGPDARLGASFLITHRLVVVFVGFGSTPAFGHSVMRALQSDFGPSIGFAYVDLLGLDTSDPEIAERVREQQLAVDHMPTGAPLPGYYLFLDGRAAAYHPGLPDLAPRSANGGGQARLNGAPPASGNGASPASGNGASPASGDSAALQDAGAGSRVASHFGRFITLWRNGAHHRSADDGSSEASTNQSWASEAEVKRAYAILGVNLDISAQALRGRYKALAIEWRADSRDRGDQTRLREANERLAALSTAYELIREHRRRLGKES